MRICCCAVLSRSRHVHFSATPWTVAQQAPLSMGTLQATGVVAMPYPQGSSQWRGSNTDLPLQADSLPSERPLGNPRILEAGNLSLLQESS